MERHLTLMVPGLLDLPPGAQEATAPHAPALCTLLARARPVPDEVLQPGGRESGVSAPEGLLFSLFGVQATADGNLPVAAVARLGDGGNSDGGWWICADPIYLHPQGAGLILSGNELLQLSAEESRGLVAELAPILTPDGWQLEALQPHHWYLRVPAPARLRTYSLEQVRGRDVGNFLPAGPDARSWHRLLTEIQLLLHASPLNAEREQHGRPPVNSLWFWGGGTLPPPGPSAWTAVWGNGSLALGLARLAGIASHGLPGSAAHWLGDAGSAGAHLVAFESGQAFEPHGEGSAWRQSVESFEQQWLSPLFGALRTGDIASLTLYSPGGVGRRLTPALLRRWWRRPGPLSCYRHG
ncbi:MAG: hypothetical protein M0Z84_07540 [Gammaproteobacteria bacterium]|nr:hypothetical protein [Gammaproteobacteria bacterium]